LILFRTNASEDEDGDDVGIFLSNPIATVLEVEPGLEGRLRREPVLETQVKQK
jgi:hypothetical protein